MTQVSENSARILKGLKTKSKKSIKLIRSQLYSQRLASEVSMRHGKILMLMVTTHLTQRIKLSAIKSSLKALKIKNGVAVYCGGNSHRTWTTEGQKTAHLRPI